MKIFQKRPVAAVVLILAIAPGEVVVYSRNYVTNRSLEEAGIKLHVIPSAELSRVRGGPLCMSMPLWREDP